SFPKPEPPRLPWPLRWFKALLDWVRRWLWWPWWWFHCKSMTKAQEVFDALKATSCDPLSVPAPCIPFLYPDDGCWARAHEMCRLMIADGAQPEKIWIFGTLPPGGISEYTDPPLHVISPNKPECDVRWYWHVAPTLQVTTGSGTETWIIDPSLFPGPVPKATWVAEQRDPS